MRSTANGTRRTAWALMAVGMALFAVACTTAESGGDAEPIEDPGTPQPKLATYRCAEGTELTVENRGGSVLIAAGEETLELPAAPGDQTSRYSQASYAILLEGTEAMWMAPGKLPVNCVR